MKKRWTKWLLVVGCTLALLLPAMAWGDGRKLLGPEPKPELQMVRNDHDGNKLFDDLDAVLSKAGASDEIPVLISMRKGMNAEQLPAELRDAGDVQQYTSFPALAGRFTPAEIRSIAALPSVDHLEWDAPVHTALDTASRYFGVTRVREAFGVTGDLDGHPDQFTTGDVVVAIIDTGIDTGHIDLTGKVVDWHDFVGGRSLPYDDNGHGSHVAGIVAGRGAGNAAYTGVAPGAALIGLKVLDSNGSGSLSTVAAALDWCVQNKQKDHIRIVNMSLGSPGPSDGTDVVSQAVNAAVSQGIAVVVAAGNEGPGSQTVGSPAAASGAITVGAMADPGEGGFSLANFSSRGPTSDGRIKPDLASPGVNIMAPKAGTRDQYVSYSGTSMATPFVAGVSALMVAAAPSITPAQIKTTLTGTALDWGGDGPDNEYGYGRLDAYAAVASTLGQSGVGGPTVPGHQRYVSELPATGQAQEFQVQVGDTQAPVAATLIMPEWSASNSPDFDLYVYDAAGHQVASSTGTQRQETAHFLPAQAGVYAVRVVSYRGSGPFWLDLSADFGTDAPPQVTIVSPSAGAEVAGDVRVTVQAQDDVGVQQVGFAVDAGPYQEITSSFDGQAYYATVHTPDLGDGQHVLHVRAVDTGGQESSASVQVLVHNDTGADWQQQVQRQGTVSQASRDAWVTINVGAPGVMDLHLNWASTADLDFYVYAPDGSYVGRAYTVNNPERMRIDTARFGTGAYRVRVNLYGGNTTNFTLLATGYARTSLTGHVAPDAPNSLQPVPVAVTGPAWMELGWAGSSDLDLYVSDPTGQLRARAYTLANPERLSFTADQTGTWQARINLYGGSGVNYQLLVWLPARCLR